MPNLNIWKPRKILALPFVWASFDHSMCCVQLGNLALPVHMWWAEYTCFAKLPSSIWGLGPGVVCQDRPGPKNKLICDAQRDKSLWLARIAVLHYQVGWRWAVAREVVGVDKTRPVLVVLLGLLADFLTEINGEFYVVILAIFAKSAKIRSQERRV